MKKSLNTKVPDEIYPGIEPIANRFLIGAEANGFKFNEGTPVAHASAMALSSATSLKRIADVLEGALGDKVGKSMTSQIRDVAIGLRHLEDIFTRPVSPELMRVLERIAESNEYTASLMPVETTLAPQELNIDPVAFQKDLAKFPGAPKNFEYDRGAPKKFTFWQRLFRALAGYPKRDGENEL